MSFHLEYALHLIARARDPLYLLHLTALFISFNRKWFAILGGLNCRVTFISGTSVINGLIMTKQPQESRSHCQDPSLLSRRTVVYEGPLRSDGFRTVYSRERAEIWLIDLVTKAGAFEHWHISGKNLVGAPKIRARSGKLHCTRYRNYAYSKEWKRRQKSV